jgi:hypothetical protein
MDSARSTNLRVMDYVRMLKPEADRVSMDAAPKTPASK